MSRLAARIKRMAGEIGFELVGIAPAKAFPEMAAFQKWVAAGYGADMHYMTEKTAPRLNPELVLPGVKSIISCGVLYDSEGAKSTDRDRPDRAWVSRYAWNTDYHFVVGDMLDRLIEGIKAEVGEAFAYRKYVDTGPLLERVFAYRAGLGWFGKNSCLIHPKLGSYFFIGEILLDIALPSDDPVPDYCGTCTRCIDACPTGAIVADGVIDSQRCISYQTIENKGTVPEELREDIGHHFFGCDICQEVCPWNRKSPVTMRPEFRAAERFFHPQLSDLAAMVEGEYPAAFKKTALKRPKQRGLLRNLLLVLGNSGRPESLAILHSLDVEGDDMLSEMRAWAIRKINSAARQSAAEPA